MKVSVASMSIEWRESVSLALNSHFTMIFTFFKSSQYFIVIRIILSFNAATHHIYVLELCLNAMENCRVFM